MVHSTEGYAMNMIAWVKRPTYRGVGNEWLVLSPKEDDSFIDLSRPHWRNYMPILRGKIVHILCTLVWSLV